MRKFLIGMLVMSQFGCATIIKGDKQSIGISSNPSGARVQYSGGIAITPSALNLETDQNYTLTLKKEGCEEASAVITKKPSGWLWGNIVLGGIIGLIVDFATGAAYKLSPENVHVVFQCHDLKPSAQETSNEAETQDESKKNKKNLRHFGYPD